MLNLRAPERRGLRSALIFFAALAIPACGGGHGDGLPPGAFSLIAPGDTAAGVSITPTYFWTGSSVATSYTLQVSTSSTFASFVVNQTGIPGTVVSPGTVLSYGSIYYWRVFADSVTGSVLATGAPWSFATVPPAPGGFALAAPADASPGVSTMPTYSWNASADAASYTLQVSTSSAFGTFAVNQSGISGTSAQPAPVLGYSTLYYWRVFADNVTGSTLSLGAPWSFTTGPPPPGPFSLLSPSDSSSAVATTPTYAWSGSTNATSYTLQVSTTSTFSGFVVDQSGLSGTSTTPGTGLGYLTTYYWRVTAVNASGTTPATGAPWTFTTTGVPPFTLSPGSLSFTLTEGGADPPDQTVDLTDTGGLGNPVSWTATSDTPWVTVSPPSGMSTPSQVTTLTVHVNATTQVGGWVGGTATLGAPSPRRLHSAAWTGNQMIVWGGSTNPAVQFDTGGRFDPGTNSWIGPTSTLNAPTGRHSHTGVGTASEMIVWSGWSASTGGVNTGGVYAPDAWSGSTALLGAPPARGDHSAVWTGGEMIIWGGWDGTLLESGARYNRAGDAWVGSTSTAGTPGGRLEHAAVWTESRMVVWGGRNGLDASSSLNTGGFYDPGTDSWTGGTSTAGAPSARTSPSAVWTGREMIVWGGHDGASYLDTGGRFHPATNAWLASLPAAGAPSPRYRHRAVWTGTRMIVWGGEDGGGSLDTGGIYQPPIPGLGPHAAAITVTATGPGGTTVQTITIGVTVNP